MRLLIMQCAWLWSFLTLHMIASATTTSTERGGSTIERLAKKMQTREANRIPVTFEIQKHFVTACQEVANGEGFKNKMSVAALRKLRDEYETKAASQPQKLSVTRGIHRALGFWNKEVTMLQVLNAGCHYVDEVEGEFFFYRDFSFYHLEILDRVRLFSNPLLSAATSLLLFYLFSAVLFCPIMKDDAVCPDRDSYDGWLTAIYFASVTMVSS